MLQDVCYSVASQAMGRIASQLLKGSASQIALDRTSGRFYIKLMSKVPQFVCLFKSYPNRPEDPAGDSIQGFPSLMYVGSMQNTLPPPSCASASVTRKPVCHSVRHALPAFRDANRESWPLLFNRGNAIIAASGEKVWMGLRLRQLEFWRCWWVTWGRSFRW